MFRPDTVSDTTPEVTQLLHSLASTPLSTTQARQPNIASHSAISTTEKGNDDAATVPPSDEVPVCGHILLSSLPRVAALARRRALLVQPSQTPRSSAQKTTVSPSLSALSPCRDVVFVRLVLSLLSYSAAEATLSPTTSTDERDLDSPAHAATPTTASDTGSPCSHHSPHAFSAVSSPTDKAACLLPWCGAEAVDDASGAFSACDVAYTVVWHREKMSDGLSFNDGDDCGATDASKLAQTLERTSTAKVVEKAAVSSEGACHSHRSPTCEDKSDNAMCQLILRSYPVSVLSPFVINSLSQYWHCGAASPRQHEKPGADTDSTNSNNNNNNNNNSNAFYDRHCDDSADSVAQALEMFRARVCRHEQHSLRSVAHTCEDLLQRLASSSKHLGRNEDADEQHMHSHGGEGRAENVSAPCTFVIPVPIYGAALSVEDNQASRLERVGHLTSPLLREASSPQSPLRPLTSVLHQLHSWAAESTNLSEQHAAQPHEQEHHALSAADCSAAPVKLTAVSSRTREEATPLSTSSSTRSPPSSLLLHLTEARLRQLREYVLQFLSENQSHQASQNPTICLPPSALTALKELDVARQCPLDRLLPASLVHCQLGVSRSPSVVVLFYLDLYRTHWRRAALARMQEQVPREQRTQHQGRWSADGAETRAERTAADTSADALGLTVDPASAAETFHALLSALVRARPRVKPNVCFAVQLLSLWKKALSLEVDRI